MRIGNKQVFSIMPKSHIPVSHGDCARLYTIEEAGVIAMIRDEMTVSPLDTTRKYTVSSASTALQGRLSHSC